MIRIIVSMIYLSCGLGVISVEQNRNPQLVISSGAMVWMVFFWPAIPSGRIYRQIFPASAE
jgi:hypothetical protein